MPLGILFEHGGQGGGVGGRRILSENSGKLNWGEGFISFGRKVDAVDGEPLRGAGVKFLRSVEQIDELHAISFGDFGHGRRIKCQVLIIRGREGGLKVGRLHVFLRDRRKKYDAGLTFAEISGEGDFEELIEVGFEFRQGRFATEGFIKAPVSENHAGVEMGSGMVGHI